MNRQTIKLTRADGYNVRASAMVSDQWKPEVVLAFLTEFIRGFYAPEEGDELCLIP
jgi:hypothetical protein